MFQRSQWNIHINAKSNVNTYIHRKLRTHLDHQADHEHHGDAGDDVRMILDDELVTEERRILRGRFARKTRLDGHLRWIPRWSG